MKPGSAIRICGEDVDEGPFCTRPPGHAGDHQYTYIPAPNAGLPTDPKARKAIPIFSGFIAYFPLALAAVAELSRIGNDQHNPGKPLHWDRTKSQDELDALARHLLDVAMEGEEATDTDDVLHLTKTAWRALAKLQKVLEGKREAKHDISPRA